MSKPPDHDQRTLPPSSKRIQDFRKRGEVALSRDLGALIGMVGAAVGIAIAAGPTSMAIQGLLIGTLGRLDGPLAPALAASASAFVGATAPAALGALLGWLLSGLQLGWPPVFKAPTLDFTKIFSPASLMQVFSPKAALGRVAFSTAKLFVVGGAAALAAYGEIADLIHSPTGEARQITARLGAAAMRLGLYAGAMLALLAVIDFIKKKRDLNAKMRMTKEEAKREARESDGDPHVKRKRKMKARELARRRIATAVKTADVVVVNPTHYAVAIRYATSKDRAPRVVAKGTDEVAARIRAVARSAGVPILSRPPLARLLHKVVPEGKEIPHALYKAVAEVLAYVYRLRRRRTRSSESPAGVVSGRDKSTRRPT